MLTSSSAHSCSLLNSSICSKLLIANLVVCSAQLTVNLVDCSKRFALLTSPSAHICSLLTLSIYSKLLIANLVHLHIGLHWCSLLRNVLGLLISFKLLSHSVSLSGTYSDQNKELLPLESEESELVESQNWLRVRTGGNGFRFLFQHQSK